MAEIKLTNKVISNNIIVKFNDKSKYSNNLNLYKRILSKMKEFNIN